MEGRHKSFSYSDFCKSSGITIYLKVKVIAELVKETILAFQLFDIKDPFKINGTHNEAIN